MVDRWFLQAQMSYLTLILSICFPLGPEETAMSQITLINKSFRSRACRGTACRNFENHHKISIFFALFTVRKRSKQKPSPSVVVALCMSYMREPENQDMSLLRLFYDSHYPPSSSRPGRVCGGERWLPARLCQHARLLPLPVPARIQAAHWRAHLHR